MSAHTRMCVCVNVSVCVSVCVCVLYNVDELADGADKNLPPVKWQHICVRMNTNICVSLETGIGTCLHFDQ